MFLLDHLFIIMFAGTQAQRILGSGRTEFRESGDDKALKAKTGTNCITIASDRAAQFFVGQQIAIGTALWNHSVLWGRTITAFKGVNRGGSSDRNLLRRRSGEYRSRKCNLVMRSEDR